MDKEVEKFTQQYLASCKEHIERLANNPELLQKTLEPFMKMQEQYLSGNNLPLESDEGYSSDVDEKSNSSDVVAELMDEVVKLKKRVFRLECKTGIKKPKSSEGNSGDSSNNNGKI